MQILLDGVSKQFGELVALDSIRVAIPPGRIVAVLGANGAGKSTLLRLLATVNVPTSGAIYFDDDRLARDRIDLRKRLMYLPEPPPVPITSTPLWFMQAMLSIYEVDRHDLTERVASLYDELDLLPLVESQFRQLSRGQIYKSALATMLAVHPELWLLDEPFAAGMDPQGASVLKRYANKAAAQGSTILFTTQMVEVAESFADDVLILDRGRLHAYTSVAELRAGASADDRVLERLFADLHASAAT